VLCSTTALVQVVPLVGLLRRGSILPFGCETQTAAKRQMH